MDLAVFLLHFVPAEPCAVAVADIPTCNMQSARGIARFSLHRAQTRFCFRVGCGVMTKEIHVFRSTHGQVKTITADDER